jgi:hypothetical protein
MSSADTRLRRRHSNWLADAAAVTGIVASVGLIGISVVLNFRIGYRSADPEFDRLLYGTAAAMADGLKAVAPFAGVAALRKRDWLGAATAATLYLVFTCYSFSAAMGFAAAHRAERQVREAAAFAAREALAREVSRIERRLDQIGHQRSPEEIDAAIAAVLARPTGGNGRTVRTFSRHCARDRKDTRAACAEIATLHEERARARSYRELTDAAATIRRTLGTAPGGMASGDVQLDVLQSLARLALWPVPRRTLEVILSVLVALLIELGSGLGLYLATTPWRSREGEGTVRVFSRPQRRKMKDAAMDGQVDEFMLDMVEPAPEGEVSNGDLYLAYRIWCDEKALAALSREQFKSRFAELAKVVQLRMSGTQGRGVWRNVSLRKAAGR